MRFAKNKNTIDPKNSRNLPATVVQMPHSPIIVSQNSLEYLIEKNIYDVLGKNSSKSNTPSSTIASKSTPNIIESITRLINEAFCLLVLLAFLQRTLNGGTDYIDREVASGRGRVDICIGYKGRKYLLVLKIKGNMTLEKSIKQLMGYMGHLQASEGWLVIFDRDIQSPSEKKIPISTRKINGNTIHIVMC
ncbi:MAG: hypothetical protein LBR80_14335 [Deltaproteobacteria bacterium]|nr:hypothetical protein [Deltaproteobacteria bacterium]